MNFVNKRVAALLLLVVAAFGYIFLSGASLFLAPSTASASAAPNGTYYRYLLGEADYVWNWDYNSMSRSQSNVDWAMRFIFKDNADIDYVKDRLDGQRQDPRITPVLSDFGGAKYAHVDDGAQHGGNYWDSDRGIKNTPNCAWNFGHMRLYAKNDRHYNSVLGYYVVASVHRDYEGFHCSWWFSSRETHEDTWINRIENNLGSNTEYNWTVADNVTSWRNGVSEETDIGGGNHAYVSDGWGPHVTVPGDDD